MLSSVGQHARGLLLQLKKSDWIPEYNTSGVRNALNESNALSKEIIDTLEPTNYRIKDEATGGRTCTNFAVHHARCSIDDFVCRCQV